MALTVKYKIYYPTGLDLDRAPEYVDLTAYQLAGTLSVPTKSGIARHIIMNKAELGVLFRDIKVGDVVLDEQEKAFIFTPMLLWAEVRITNKPQMKKKMQ